MIRIALLIALLLGGMSGSLFKTVWGGTGPDADPDGKPHSGSLLPSPDGGALWEGTGPDIDPDGKPTGQGFGADGGEVGGG
jgi:hypothetical protein